MGLTLCSGLRSSPYLGLRLEGSENAELCSISSVIFLDMAWVTCSYISSARASLKARPSVCMTGKNLSLWGEL